MRKKLAMGSVRSQKPTTTPLQTTYSLVLYLKEFKIVPPKKREELIKILDDVIQRLLKLINSKRTTTSVRLKAMAVLNELINTSYRMIREIEVESLERETETLEEEAERTETEDNAKEDSAKPA